MSTEQSNEAIELELSPIILKFAELFKEASKSSKELDMEFLPAEFRGWPEDPKPHIVFFKRKGREYWVLNYHIPRVAIYRIKKHKYKDESTGEKVEEDIVVHDRTIFNFVPVEIREFHDFTLELAAREAKMRAPVMYQWMIAENALKGPIFRELEPVLPVELLDKLKEIGGLYTNENLAKEAIDSILVLAKYLGAVEHVDRPMTPGIYWNPKKNQLEAYEYDTSMPSRVQVREALVLLDKMTRTVPDGRWYNSWPVKFGKAIKWSLVAGLGYAYKVYNEKRRWVPYLLFVGESNTGKTHAIARTISEIWFPLATSASAGSAWSLYNFSELASSVASVIIINEAATLFRSLNFGDEGDNFFNLIKNAPEQYLFRTKSYKGVRKVYPSLATFAFNANMPGIKDEAIRRRFFTIEFTKVDKIPSEAIEYFEKYIIPQMGVLSAIGRFVFNVIKEEPTLLGLRWNDLAEELIKRLYDYAVLEIPEWLQKAELVDKYREELEAEKITRVVSWLKDYFNDIYFRYSRYADSSTPLRDRILYVLEHEMSPHFILRGKKEVIIKSTLLDELRKTLKIDIYNFKALCELLGWEYKQRRVNKYPTWVGVINIEDFFEFLGAREGPLEIDMRVAHKVVDILAMGNFTFDELVVILNIDKEELAEILNDLEKNLVILPQDGRYKLNRSRARELGFDVVDSYVLTGGGK